jgi:hypothetical protein
MTTRRTSDDLATGDLVDVGLTDPDNLAHSLPKQHIFELHRGSGAGVMAQPTPKHADGEGFCSVATYPEVREVPGRIARLVASCDAGQTRSQARSARWACGQNGSPATNVAPDATKMTAASTLLRPSRAQYTSLRSSNSASSSTTRARADP